ncbi:MAG TPA: hypothetical protein VJS64_18800 [Pyrinomonadaceae bacterium]|nr:hypothetical protein [Pyrinomonadaceae bacterium]
MFSHSHHVGTRLILVVLAYLTFCSVSIVARGQSVQCKATLRSLPAAPELKGFQLGMTREQLKVLTPEMVFSRTDSFGSSKTTINPAFDPRAERSKFQDVRTISLDLLDGRVVSLWIGYDKNFKWNTVPDFVTGISQSLSLPNAWTEWRSRGRNIICTDFEITVSIIANSLSFRLVDTVAAETLAARRGAAANEAEASETEDSNSEEIVADRKTKTYYQGNCRPPDSIAEADRITFKSSGEAEKAGYTLSRGCS